MGNASQPLQSIVVVGRGLVAWGAVVTLAQFLGKAVLVTLVVPRDDEDDVCPVEIAQPALLTWLDMVGLSEPEVMARSHGLYSLGIAYERRPRDFFLSYGRHGIAPSPASFEQEFFRAYPPGEQVRFTDHFLAAQMAHARRFDFPVNDPRSVKSTLRYGVTLHTDSLCALLRERAEALGVRVVYTDGFRVEADDQQGIRALVLSQDQTVRGDFYLDATGSASRLLGGALAVPFEQAAEAPLWPTRLTVCQSENFQWQPYVRMRREPWGWIRESALRDQRVTERWLSAGSDIGPLDDDEADSSRGESVRVRAERYGIYAEPWRHNCLALGRAAGHPGDLLASEWHRACQSLLLWLELYPDQSGRPALRAEFNRRERERYEGWLDVHWLHGLRDAAQAETLPEPLGWRLQMFQNFGRLWRRDEEPLSTEAWVALLLGLGWTVAHSDTTLAAVPIDQLKRRHEQIYTTLVTAAERMPTLEQVIQHHCPAVV